MIKLLTNVALALAFIFILLPSKYSPISYALAADDINAELVQIIDTSSLSPPSPDPSGIVYYVDHSSLLVSDGEVEETIIFEGNNLFELSPYQFLIDSFDSTGFSNEPTGLAFNLIDGHLFISDDDRKEIFEVDPGLDSELFTIDDVVSSFDTRIFESKDPEGIAFDSALKIIYISDGVNSEIYKVTPGINEIFDGIPPIGDDQVSNFDTEILGLTDPEGIEFDMNTGDLLIVGNPRNIVFRVSTDGELVQRIHLPTKVKKPSGIALAPSSENTGVMNLFITDRGVDNDSDPNENDGKIYEYKIPNITTPGNTAPIVDAGNDQTIQFPDFVVLNGSVVDDGIPNPPGVIDTQWIKESGDGEVVFDDAFAESTTANFSLPGNYVFKLIANDSELSTSDTVNITMVGSSPIANDDLLAATTSENTEVITLNVLSNDLLVDNAVISNFDSVSLAGGSVAFNGDGTFTYIPLPDYIGIDSFSYTLTDDDMEMDTASVFLQVNSSDSRLIAFWPFNESIGTSAGDYSGNGHTGVLTNGVFWSVENGVEFDGVDDYVDVGKLDISENQVTITATFRSSSLSNCKAQDCRIISKATSTTGSDHFFMLSTISNSAGTRLRFRLKINGETNTLIASVGDIFDNEWVHIAGVYDSQFMRLYKDAVEVGSQAVSGAISQNSEIPVWIGGNPPSADSRPWKGEIADVRIYDSALTPLQILALLNGDTNLTPVAVDDIEGAVTAINLSVTTVNVLVNDVLVDNALISSFDANSINGGFVVHNGDGTFNYTPPDQYTGQDSFTYTLTDDDLESSTAIVTVTVNPDSSSSPIAVDDLNAAETTQNNSIQTINVLENDTIVDNASITTYESSSINGGNITYNGDGTFNYSPAIGYSGDDSFTYTLTDDDLQSSTASVFVTVTIVVSSSPIATDDLPGATTTVGTEITTLNVLENDYIVDNAVIISYDTTGTEGGLIFYNGNGTFTYTPVVQFVGTDTFTYTLTDDQQEASTATVSIIVVSPDSGLIAFWPLDELTGATAPDNSGNGNTGTLINGPLWTGGQGVSLDGIDDYINVGLFDVSGDQITLAASFKAENLSNCNARDCRLISKATSTATDDHYFMISTIKVQDVTRLRFRIKVADITHTLIATSGDIENNLWIHAAAVYDGFMLRLYKDGIEVGSKVLSGLITNNNNVPAWIGGNPPSSVSRPWAGYIKDVRVYSRGLGNSEILALSVDSNNYKPIAVDDSNAANTVENTAVTTINVLDNDTLVDNAVISVFDLITINGGTVSDNGDGTFNYTPPTDFTGMDSFTYTLTDDDMESSTAIVTMLVGSPLTGLLGYWPMEEGGGLTTEDVSGNGHTGTLMNGIFWSSNGLGFDGIDDYVNLGAIDVMGNQLTLAAWINAADLSNCSFRDCRIVSKAIGTDSSDHYFMLSTVKVNEGTRLRFRLKVEGVTSTLIADTGDILENQWIHIAAVYDGQEIRLYKDGNEVGSKLVIGNITSNSDVPMWVGANPLEASGRPWKGFIDDVRIYSRVLSNTEINILVNQGQ